MKAVSLVLFSIIFALLTGCGSIKVFSPPKRLAEQVTLWSMPAGSFQALMSGIEGKTRQQVEAGCGWPAMTFEEGRIAVYRFIDLDGTMQNILYFTSECYYRMEQVHLVLVYDEKETVKAWSLLKTSWADRVHMRR
jgi:hypothetical protein